MYACPINSGGARWLTSSGLRKTFKDGRTRDFPAARPYRPPLARSSARRKLTLFAAVIGSGKTNTYSGIGTRDDGRLGLRQRRAVYTGREIRRERDDDFRIFVLRTVR